EALEAILAGIPQGGDAVHRGRDDEVAEVHPEAACLQLQPPAGEPAPESRLVGLGGLGLEQTLSSSLAFADPEVEGGRLERGAVVGEDPNGLAPAGPRRPFCRHGAGEPRVRTLPDLLRARRLRSPLARILALLHRAVDTQAPLDAHGSRQAVRGRAVAACEHVPDV